MADPSTRLTPALRAAFAQVTGLPEDELDPVVRPSDHADVQINGALALAKRVGRPPRDVAQAVLDSGVLDGWGTGEVAGPGFINVVWDRERLVSWLAEMGADEHLGVTPAAPAERVVVDYSALNVAKEAHAGHLRTTVIGDALVRMLAFVGHEVIRENHIGDWGTPFGMLIEHLIDEGGTAAVAEFSIADLGGFYRAARAKFDHDEDFKERARRRVTLLQRRDDAETMHLWQTLVDESVHHFNDIYAKLGVLLTDDDLAGESTYQELMVGVVPRLAAAGILTESDGAQVVFPPGFTNRDGDPLPLIVQARTGGFPYATSDIACVIDRVERLGATLMLYVVGTPQALHLAMVAKVCEMAGILRPPARMVHVNFGSVLGEDRKMLRSRDGAPVTLDGLVDEAIERGRFAVAERSNELSEAEVAELGARIGIGALKYAELSTDRIKDYVFDWDRLLAFEGDTGPYLMYAHARICSIFRRAGVERGQLAMQPAIGNDAERQLAIGLLGFDAAVQAALATFSPHKLTTYLFDLAQRFTAFYEASPVLRAEEPLRTARLALCELTARVLSTGLGLLGIDAPARM